MTTAADASTDTGQQTTIRSRARRYWEIDTLRGVAIVMMVIYHLMWDFWYFQVLPNVVLYEGFWKYFQRTCANLFLILVGVSLAVVTIRRMGDDSKSLPRPRPYLLRGLRIFGWGMAITVIVAFANIGYVHFGILHLIGAASILAYPFLRLRWINLGLWALLFVAGFLLLDVRVDFPWLLWLGLTPEAYFPNDYFPLIPYFGVVLLGIFLGNTFYGPYGRRFPLPDLSGWVRWTGLSWMGRHSLPIYLVHQPLLFVILWALGIIRL